MSTLTERGQVIGLVRDAIAAGASQERACGAISLSERTLQRWQRDQSRGISVQHGCKRPKISSASPSANLCWQSPTRMSLDISRPARSCPGWPTGANTSPRSQPFTGCSKRTTNFSTAMLSGPGNNAASRVRCAQRPPMNSSVGTSPICQR